MNKGIENRDALYDNLVENISEIRMRMENSSDLLERQISIDGVKVCMIMCEGMVNSQLYSHLIVQPLKGLKIKDINAEKLLDNLRNETILAADQKEILTFSDLFTFIMSGFVVVLIDGIAVGIACGLQGFNFRSVGEVTTEANVRGSKEGFVEPLRINQTLIRRRIKSPTLKFELLSVGDKSRTDISLIYLTDVVSKKLVNEVKRQLTKISPDIILNSGYIQPFLERQSGSFFGGTAVTERPDTLCAKINEGRIGILVDGTPFAIIVPYLFTEHFQSIDDYAYRP
ncbi:MAG: spore germination protein, partial [Oscillospiraceae bacterium]